MNKILKSNNNIAFDHILEGWILKKYTYICLRDEKYDVKCITKLIIND